MTKPTQRQIGFDQGVACAAALLTKSDIGIQLAQEILETVKPDLKVCDPLDVEKLQTAGLATTPTTTPKEGE